MYLTISVHYFINVIAEVAKI